MYLVLGNSEINTPRHLLTVKATYGFPICTRYGYGTVLREAIFLKQKLAWKSVKGTTIATTSELVASPCWYYLRQEIKM